MIVSGINKFVLGFVRALIVVSIEFIYDVYICDWLKLSIQLTYMTFGWTGNEMQCVITGRL